MTRNVLAVLRARIEAPEQCHVQFGSEILSLTGLTGGSVYPMLYKLEEEGWLVSDEEPSPTKGRPARGCYRFTETGLAQARAALAMDNLSAPRFPGSPLLLPEAR